MSEKKGLIELGWFGEMPDPHEPVVPMTNKLPNIGPDQIIEIDEDGKVTVLPDFTTGHTAPCELIVELKAALALAQQERDEARAIVANVNNSVIGSQGYFTEPDCVEAIETLKAHANRTVHRAEAAEQAHAALVQEQEQAEQTIRAGLWVNHGCPFAALYGDDGEMQCNQITCRIDFKREPLPALLTRLFAMGRLHAGILEESEAHAALVAALKETVCSICGYYFNTPLQWDGCHSCRAVRAALTRSKEPR